MRIVTFACVCETCDVHYERRSTSPVKRTSTANLQILTISTNFLQFNYKSILGSIISSLCKSKDKSKMAHLVGEILGRSK